MFVVYLKAYRNHPPAVSNNHMIPYLISALKTCVWQHCVSLDTYTFLQIEAHDD